MNRKALYFSIDAFLASVLLITAAYMIFQFTDSKPDIRQIDYVSKDITNAISEIKINELNNSWVQAQISNGSISDPNVSILVQVGNYWVNGNYVYIDRLLDIVVNDSLPDRFGFSFKIGDETVYSKNITNVNNLVTARRMISGIAQGLPTTGSASSAYLRKIRNKPFSSYLYFGGFVGQGNITGSIRDIPDDVNSSSIQELILELDVASNFTLYINGDQCNSEFEPAHFNMSADRWDITGCNSSIIPGQNNFTFVFEGINNSYIAGGYVKLTYHTEQIQDASTPGTLRYYFPRIEGIPNLYDSFYIPGTLNSMGIYLHYNSNSTTYITIGEKTAYQHVANGTDIEAYLNSTYLQQAPQNLDYVFLSNKTIPIRFASYNYTSEIVTGGNADIVLITDFSGSMKKAVSDNTALGTGVKDCDELYGYDDARKSHLARCVDNELVDIVMNYTGNRIWPVFLHSDEIEWYNNPSDKDAIKSYISNFGPQGKDQTCLSCAVNRAYDILDSFSNSSRAKFIVFMTDGVPTHCAEDNCTSGTSDDYLTPEICEGYCDTQGGGGSCDFEGCNDNACEEAINHTIFSVQRAVDDLNTTVFSVGFGLISECSSAVALLEQVATIGNGTYMNSSNTTRLKEIYEEIAYDILTRINQSSQLINVQGDYTPAMLYDDSFIEFNYTPIVDPPESGEISLVFQTNTFDSCDTNFEVFEGLRVVDAKLTSYSGSHWTNTLVVNNITVFNMSEYLVPYPRLGDPFYVQIPVNLLIHGINNITFNTADTPDNITGCSMNNSVIYTALANSSTVFTDVKPTAIGCHWRVEFEDGDFLNFTIPQTYSGSDNCEYTAASISYDSDDAYDFAVYSLISQFDYDNDGRLLININQADLEVVVVVVPGVPYLWGPSLTEVNVWY